ncbi:PREDICTED: uncharacterized protein LOC109220607 [Nicotiana attenuata]|nr:PREDICTED: uncharacterized protein LOC109220607 [Nicotiana attenuata]
MQGNTNKKKAKRGVEKEIKEVKIEVQERNDIVKSVMTKPAELIAECDKWINNEGLCSWSSDNIVEVDEQMSWGTCWSPVWDVEFMGEAYNNLYNDVLWDDDIWNLQAIKEVPSP